MEWKQREPESTAEARRTRNYWENAAQKDMALMQTSFFGTRTQQSTEMEAATSSLVPAPAPAPDPVA